MRRARSFLNSLARLRSVAIFRAPDTRHFSATAHSLLEQGVTVMEFSLTTPGALNAINDLADQFLSDDAWLGAGTVTSLERARAAVDSGAAFLVSPAVDVRVIDYARARGVPILAGAFTPTEVLTAWEAGATAVKVFPASLGGSAYCGALAAPFPEIPLVPTGGIDLNEIDGFLTAGSLAVGLGSPLLGSSLVDGTQDDVVKNARTLTSITSRHASTSQSN